MAAINPNQLVLPLAPYQTIYLSFPREKDLLVLEVEKINPRDHICRELFVPRRPTQISIIGNSCDKVYEIDLPNTKEKEIIFTHAWSQGTRGEHYLKLNMDGSVDLNLGSNLRKAGFDSSKPDRLQDDPRFWAYLAQIRAMKREGRGMNV